jgi:hypothetical protein
MAGSIKSTPGKTCGADPATVTVMTLVLLCVEG